MAEMGWCDLNSETSNETTNNEATILRLDGKDKIQVARERAYLESGSWVGLADTILEFEWQNTLRYLNTNLIRYASLHENVSCHVHEPGKAMSRATVADNATDVFFRVLKSRTDICFFIRGMEVDADRVRLLVYFPWLEPEHWDLWTDIHTELASVASIRSIPEVLLSGAEESSAPAVAEQPQYEELTQREKEVVDLLARGYRDQQIADTLLVARSTVISFRKDISKKWGITQTIGVMQMEARRRGYKQGEEKTP